MEAALIKYGLIVAFLLAILGVVGLHYHNQAITECNNSKLADVNKANGLLLQKTKEVDQLNLENQKLADQLSQQYTEKQNEINSLHDKLSKLGRLHDPYAINTCSNSLSKSSTTSAATPTTSTIPGDLSDKATEFLRELTRECDSDALYAQQCYTFTHPSSGK